MNIKKILGSSFLGGCAISSVVSCHSVASLRCYGLESSFVENHMDIVLVDKFCRLIDAMADLFKQGGLNESSKNNYISCLEGLSDFQNKYHNESVKFDDRTRGWVVDRVEEYARQKLPDWVQKLGKRGDYSGVPAEQREALGFMERESESRVRGPIF